MAPIHRQFIPEPQSRAASQRKQLPVSPYGSLCASQRGLHQCQDVAECLEVWWLWMGGHRRLQNGVIPYGPSRQFHEIPLFSLPQEQYNENMTGDYIWGPLWESDLQYTLKSRKHNHLWTIVSDYWLPLSICHASAVFTRPHKRQYKNFLVLSQKFEIFLCCGRKI